MATRNIDENCTGCSWIFYKKYLQLTSFKYTYNSYVCNHLCKCFANGRKFTDLNSSAVQQFGYVFGRKPATAPLF